MERRNFKDEVPPRMRNGIRKNINKKGHNLLASPGYQSESFKQMVLIKETHNSWLIRPIDKPKQLR